jgi:RNA:NAD 2'-phosphotransferase (TPT1/KptA family)
MINPGDSAYDVAIDEKWHPYLYHGTRSTRAGSIKKKGLQPVREHGQFGHYAGSGYTHMTHDPYEAAEYATSHERTTTQAEAAHKHARGKPVVVKIHRNHPAIKRLEQDPYSSTASYRMHGHIPPEAIHSINRVGEGRKSSVKWTDKEYNRVQAKLSQKKAALKKSSSFKRTSE